MRRVFFYSRVLVYYLPPRTYVVVNLSFLAFRWGVGVWEGVPAELVRLWLLGFSFFLFGVGHHRACADCGRAAVSLGLSIF